MQFCLEVIEFECMGWGDDGSILYERTDPLVMWERSYDTYEKAVRAATRSMLRRLTRFRYDDLPIFRLLQVEGLSRSDLKLPVVSYRPGKWWERLRYGRSDIPFCTYPATVSQ